jgi:hypothetical protein
MSLEAGQTSVIEIFVSYAHEDERLKKQLIQHLSPLVRQRSIHYWDDQQLCAGEQREEIFRYFDAAHIILCLISPSFVSSNYCYDVEMKRAWQRRELDEAIIIPILLRPVDWSNLPFRTVQVIPRTRKPITRHSNRDQAFAEVAKEIGKVVTAQLRKHTENGRIH